MIGYEILRKIKQSDAPWFPIDHLTDRAALGTRSGVPYLVPLGLDIFELGLVDMAGPFELLPITSDQQELWDDIVHLLVTEAQAEQQRALLLRLYRTLHEMILEADYLESTVKERGMGHPVFEMLRVATIDVWKAQRRGNEPLTERTLSALHTRVARRVAVEIRAHIIR